MARKTGHVDLKLTLTPDVLKQELETLSTTQIAEKYNCSQSTISRIKNDYGMIVKSHTVADKYKLRPSEELIFALEDRDLTFTKQEVADIKELWIAGIHFTDMAAKLKRHYLEVLAMLIDMVDKGKLEPRKNGVYGEV